ncbi:hypothetical protein OAM01_03450, partial [bacterium]|nr:hypothetical protein [bacterium]
MKTLSYSIPLIRLTTWFCWLIVINANNSVFGAEQTQSGDVLKVQDWEFVVAPYGLLASIDGDSTVGRLGSQPLQVDAGTILDNLETAVMVHAEARKGPWGIMLDLIYVEMDLKGSSPRGGFAKADVDELVLESMFSYRVNQSRNSLDFYVGVRYWDLDLDFALTGPGGVGSIASGGGDRWVDPVVGVRKIQYLSDRWFLIGRADIGGFHVGSDLSWQVEVGGGYEFSDRFALSLQY